MLTFDRKTSGYGHKGQGARRTKKHPRFEGGQNPLYKRLPKITMRRVETILEYVTIEKILYGAQRGYINLEEEINMRALVKAGLVSTPKNGVELRVGVSFYLLEDCCIHQNLILYRMLISNYQPISQH